MPAEVETMFSVREVPWHGLGTIVPERLPAAEAIKTAGLDWEVEKQNMYLSDDSIVPEKMAVVRTDTNAVVGVVGDNYVPVQNHEAFGFFDGVVGDGLAIYETAGSLRGGSRVWMLAKLPDHLVVGNDDAIQKYLLLSNAHNGTSALRMFYTPVRVVCQNTLNMAMKGAGQDGVSVRHIGNVDANIKEAQRLLKLAHQFYDDFGQRCQVLTDRQITDQELTWYFDYVFPRKEQETKSGTARYEKQREQLMEFYHAETQKKIRGTLWGAFNTVVEWRDWGRPIRANSSPEKRLEQTWFGSKITKTRAWAGAEVLLNQ